MKTEGELVWALTHGIKYIITDDPLLAICLRNGYKWGNGYYYFAKDLYQCLLKHSKLIMTFLMWQEYAYTIEKNYFVEIYYDSKITFISI